MAKKKTSAKKNTEQLRKQAIKDIDVRLNGDATPAKKGRATKGKASEKKTPAKAAKTKMPRKPSGLDSAAQVLAASGVPLRSKDIVDTMLAKGLWTTNGKTPHSTIYAAIIREIQNKGDASRFEKVDRGRFQIRKGA